ncbi:MAG: hypothetical protein ABFD97_07160 [Syntrophobacter sp.]
MKRFLAVRTFAVLVLIMLAFGAAPVLAEDTPVNSNAGTNATINGPKTNPYLASSLYGIVHFDPSSSDSTPYGPPKGVFVADSRDQKVAYAAPGNLMMVASTDPHYMWEPGSDRVQYIRKSGGQWVPVARLDILNKLNSSFAKLTNPTIRKFGKTSVAGMTPSEMDTWMQSILGTNYSSRGGNGIYTLVDNKNVLYAVYNGSIVGIGLKDPNRPEAGLKIKYRLDDPVTKIQGVSGARVGGLSMTYDGHLIVTFSNGISVVDRKLTLSTKSYYAFGTGERVTNSICVDENNGIYVASNSIMRKLVWTGTALSDQASDGAWSSTYTSGTETAPIVRFDNGTGSTPTLMGFGSDTDKLVVLTDGAKVMNLVAFWRDAIPAGFTERVAGQIQVTCGYKTLPEWIQSEQSVVVRGYGAFVVNNIPESVPAELKAGNQMTKAGLLGPTYTPPYGVERFAWDTTTHSWSSVWGRSDVSSPTMIPIHCDTGNMAVVGGYMPDLGWVIQGMDWDTGDTVHLTFLGPWNLGNGYYAIVQFLGNGDLVLNGFAGSLRVHYDQ